MTTERDELAKLIDPQAFKVGNSLPSQMRCIRQGLGLGLADAILAAGFRKGTEEVEYSVAGDHYQTGRIESLGVARLLALPDDRVITKRSRWVTDWVEEVVE
jgi:hypothetical protein